MSCASAPGLQQP